MRYLDIWNTPPYFTLTLFSLPWLCVIAGLLRRGSAVVFFGEGDASATAMVDLLVRSVVFVDLALLQRR